MKFYVIVFGLFIALLIFSCGCGFAIDAFREARQQAKRRKQRKAVDEEMRLMLEERRMVQQVGRR